MAKCLANRYDEMPEPHVEYGGGCPSLDNETMETSISDGGLISRDYPSGPNRTRNKAIPFRTQMRNWAVLIMCARSRSRVNSTSSVHVNRIRHARVSVPLSNSCVGGSL